MSIDLNELLALAEKATPGPWRYQGFSILEPTGYFGVQVAEPSNILFEDVKKQDAEFITAADPAVVADIIKRLQIAEVLNETTPQTLTPQSEGLILVTVNENLMRFRSETLNDATATLRRRFPKQKVIFIADWLSLRWLSQKQLHQLGLAVIERQ